MSGESFRIFSIPLSLNPPFVRSFVSTTEPAFPPLHENHPLLRHSACYLYPSRFIFLPLFVYRNVVNSLGWERVSWSSSHPLPSLSLYLSRFSSSTDFRPLSSATTTTSTTIDAAIPHAKPLQLKLPRVQPRAPPLPTWVSHSLL